MPTYQFTCEACRTQEEINQPITKDLETPSCRECSKPMTRNYSIGAVTFNGAGFYRNDK